MFWSKNWYWLLMLIVVFGIGGFILLKPKTSVTAKKVYKKADISQVRKDVSSKGDKTPAEQSTKENTDTHVEIPPVPTDDMPETVSESPVETVPLENAEEETPESEAEIEDWRTIDYGESYFGFGAYPKIPPDLPRNYRPGWTRTNAAIQREEVQEMLRAQELLDRVRIKLWNQGRTDVTTIDLSPVTNKVYPLTTNTVTVKYTGTGDAKRVSTVFTDLNFPQDLVERIKDGERPAGVQILDFDSDGFDVYEFLELTK